MDEIDNPFDGEAARIFHEQGVSEQEARDFVVLRYLRDGDTSALAHWLMTNYDPGKTVKLMLSYMLQPKRQDAEDASKELASDPNKVPYELVAKRRDGKSGRPVEPLTAEKNQAIQDLYNKLVTEIGPGGSDSAVSHLAQELGPDITMSMIKEAIKGRSPKPIKGKK